MCIPRILACFMLHMFITYTLCYINCYSKRIYDINIVNMCVFRYNADLNPK